MYSTLRRAGAMAAKGLARPAARGFHAAAASRVIGAPRVASVAARAVGASIPVRPAICRVQGVLGVPCVCVWRV